MRSLAGVVVAVAAATTLAACTWEIRNNRHFEDDRTETGTVTSVKLLGGDGGVTVMRGSGSSVQIHRRVSYGKDRPSRPHDRLEGTTLVLDTRCGKSCAISYTVRVPGEVSVSGHLDTGPVELSGVSKVAVDTNDGGISVNGASGDVSARTDTGPIRLAEVAGTVTARSADGGITVRSAAKAVTVRTDTGPVELSDVAGTITAITTDGGIRMDRIGGQVTAETETGPIAGTALGGRRTIARTTDGGITLRLSTVQDVEARTQTGPILLAVPPAEGGYRVRTSSETGPTQVNITTNPTGARSLSLSSQDGGITINPA